MSEKAVVIYKPCGCMCFAAMKVESNAKDIGKAMTAAIKSGWQTGEATPEEVRASKWRCDDCEPASPSTPKGDGE